MVENQHSINTVLSFGAKSVAPKILEKLLVGRHKNAEYLFKSIEGIVNNGNNQHILVIGQRGMGKTHLLRILYHRSQTFIEEKRLMVAYFSEEEYGVANYFDFLVRILYSFIRWNETDKNILEEKMVELQEMQSVSQVFFAEKIIEEYIKEKPLLILTENFGDILNAIGSQEQGKLRAWLFKNKRVSIIATNQSISDDFDSEDRPFYGFFNTIYLKPLSYKDSLNFIISLAELDGRTDVVDHLKYKGKSQVRAIHELVKGNHRLLVTFYEFLKSDTLAKLSKHFIKTINDLKPYYETFIRYLPAQQQKIIRYVALSRKPQQGTAISKNCFIDQSSLSKQLSELVRKKLLEAIPDQRDKRNKLYDINEPLLRISIEVGEHKEGITALFIDFLALYYDENELTNKRLKFADLLSHCENSMEKREFLYEIQAIEKALSLKKPNAVQKELVALKSVRSILENYKEGDFALGIFELENAKSLIDEENYQYFLSTLYILDHQYVNALAAFEKLSRGFIKAEKIYAHWAFLLAELAKLDKQHETANKSLEKFELADQNNESTEFVYSEWGNLLLRQGTYTENENMILLGLEKLNLARMLNPKHDGYYLNLAHGQMVLLMMKKDQSLIEAAFENFSKALSINPQNLDIYAVWGGALAFGEKYIENKKEYFDVFLMALKELSMKSRKTIYTKFSSLPQIAFFKELLPTLISDIINDKERFQSILIDWLNLILRSANKAQSLNKVDLVFLKDVTDNYYNIIPELEITRTYIEIFEEYVLNGNKNAIYDLPKEQRIFFENTILDDDET